MFGSSDMNSIRGLQGVHTERGPSGGAGGGGGEEGLQKRNPP